MSSATRKTPARNAGAKPEAQAFESPDRLGSVRLSALQAFVLPMAFSIGLLAFTGLDAVRLNPNLLWSFQLASAALIAWGVVLFLFALRSGRTFTVEIVLRKQHYLQ